MHRPEKKRNENNEGGRGTYTTTQPSQPIPCSLPPSVPHPHAVPVEWGGEDEERGGVEKDTERGVGH